MIDYEYLKSVSDIIRSLREFPLPALLADTGFQVRWSNDLAKQYYSHITAQDGLLAVLSEFDPAGLMEQISSTGNCTIRDIFPLSAVCLSMSPVFRNGAMVGITILLMGTDTMLGTRNFHQLTKSSGALSLGISSAVADVFDIMDIAASKADLIDAGWFKRGLEQISWYMYRILRISNNIAEFNRFQSGMQEFRFEGVDLFGLLRDMQPSLVAIAQSIDVRLDFSVPDMPAGVRLDTEKFELILFNVIHNALFFGKPGNRIYVRARKKASFLEIEVEDRGIGMTDEVLANIFQPYYCHHPAGYPPTVGLGLALVRILMEAHDGEVSAQSAPGRGTRVILRFREGAFSQTLPLAQGIDPLHYHDRFSSVYTGLTDAQVSPYRSNPQML